ncbi:MAG TPA: nitroreductase family protein [Mycobacterium sp.]|jgi:nitroreductase
MTPLNLSVDEVLTTTRSVRKRLDFDKPVPRQVLLECLELAIQAPTGSNAQGWQWVFVEDPDKKKALGEIYRKNFEWYAGQPKPEYSAEDTRTQQRDRVVSSAMYLAEHMHEAPALLVPCLEGSVDQATEGAASFWGSLLPAVWSYMLALRSRGLGSAWTTLHLLGSGEKKAADLLGIPFQQYRQGGLFPVAYTKGTDFRPAKRLPVEQIVHFDSW